MSLALHHTNACKISRLCEAVSSLVSRRSRSKLGNQLILRRSFQLCYLLTNTSQKLEKPWKSLFRGSVLRNGLKLKGLRHGDLADFWPKLSWKLVVANLIHSEHFL